MTYVQVDLPSHLFPVTVWNENFKVICYINFMNSVKVPFVFQLACIQQQIYFLSYL